MVLVAGVLVVAGALAGDAGALGDGADAAALVAAVAGAVLGDAEASDFGAPPPLIAAANAVRLERTVVSFARVSSSRFTAASAFEGIVPDVPVGFGSVGVAALGAPVDASAVRSSDRILSAAAASDAHFSEPFALALASAGSAAIFSSAFTCFLRSAICDLAFPETAEVEMLFNASSAAFR